MQGFVMKSSLIQSALRVGVITGAMVFAMPATAQDSAIPQANQIIEALQAQDQVAVGSLVEEAERATRPVPT